MPPPHPRCRCPRRPGRTRLRAAKAAGWHYLILDGTLIPIDRVAADRSIYSGKHRLHGMNLQVIATTDGTIVWVSGALRGSVHDLKAVKIWGILRALERAGLITLADKGYHGADELVSCPYKTGHLAKAIHILQDREIQATAG